MFTAPQFTYFVDTTVECHQRSASPKPTPQPAKAIARFEAWIAKDMKVVEENKLRTWRIQVMDNAADFHLTAQKTHAFLAMQK